MSFSDTLAKAVLSTSFDAIIAADEEGIIRFWNPGAEHIFGYARDAAIGRSLDIIIPERLRKPLSSRSCRCAMELATSPGWQRSCATLPCPVLCGNDGIMATNV
jgi:PAS domain S-box-containing protein